MKALLVIAVLVGCGNKRDPAAEARVACASAVDRSIELTLAKRKGKAVDVSALAPKMKTAITELCIADRWPADVVACFQTAEDIAGCRDKLKPEQRQRFTAEAMKIRIEAVGSGSGSGSGSGTGGSTIVPL